MFRDSLGSEAGGAPPSSPSASPGPVCVRVCGHCFCLNFCPDSDTLATLFLFLGRS